MLYLNLFVVAAVLAVGAPAPLMNEPVTRALTPPPPDVFARSAQARPRRDVRRTAAGGLLSGLSDAAEDLRGALTGARPKSSRGPLPPPPPLVPAGLLNRGLGKALSTVSILGQIDSYVAERARTLVRKLLLLVSDEDLMAEYYKTRQPYDNAV